MTWSPLSPIPTDTYYKFKAMAGIWLVVGAVVGASLAFFKFESEAFQVGLRAAALATEIRLGWQKLVVEVESSRRLKERHAATVREGDSVARDLAWMKDAIERGPNPEQALALEQLLNAAERRIASIHSQQAEIDSALREAEKRIAERQAEQAPQLKEASLLEAMSDHLRELLVGFVVMLVIAVAVTIFGVRLARSGLTEWRAIQAAQDEYLRRSWEAHSSAPPATSPTPTPTTPQPAP